MGNLLCFYKPKKSRVALFRGNDVIPKIFPLNDSIDGKRAYSKGNSAYGQPIWGKPFRNLHLSVYSKS